MAASSIPKTLEILFLCFTVRSKLSRTLLDFCFVSFRVLFLEFIVNPRKSISYFGLREDFYGWTWKTRL